ncbi:MAG TPA: hypothetical protein VFY04_06180 [Solirubrobacterales bacterium]|nr:hypothetical protein [Solirubrobacterales bacterium]
MRSSSVTKGKSLGLVTLALVLLAASLLPAQALAAKAHPFIGTFGSAEQPSFTLAPASKVRAMATDELGRLLVADIGERERQTIDRNGATGGTYVLCFEWKGASACTGAMAANLAGTGTPSVQSELRALATVGPVGNLNVAVSGTGEAVRTVTFQNDRAAADVPQLSCNGLGLTFSGPAPEPPCTVTTTVPGSTANVSRWNPDGTPAPFSALSSNRIDARGGGAFPGDCPTVPEDCDQTPEDGLTGFGLASRDIQVVVDESGGPTDGTLYVTQSTKRLVDIFAPNGRFVGQVNKFGPLVPGPQSALGEPCGVAVDASGAVYIGDFNAIRVHKYVPSKTAPIDLVTNEDFEVTFPPVNDEGAISPCTLAAGAGPTEGFLFVNQRGGGTFKLDATTGTTHYKVGTTTSNATVTVDPITGHVLVANGAEVLEYDASSPTDETLVATTNAGANVFGVAVDPLSGNALQGNSGKVYVARQDKATLDEYGALEVLGPRPVLGPATDVTQTSATLTGTVDPRGAATEDCHFEYILDSVYQANPPAERFLGAASSPCDPNPGSANDDVPVSASIAGLTPHATYHYRLLIKTSDGENASAEEEFIASLRPTATTDSATSIAPTTATLHATVNPKGGLGADCSFEYGTTTSYGSSAPCVPDPGDANVDTAVSTNIVGLEPKTTYHFRIAIETDGSVKTDEPTVHGQDETFFTTDQPTIEVQFETQVGETTATLNARIVSNDSPTTYRLEWGPTSSYGNVIPGSIPAGQDSVLVSHDVTGLEPGTTYHFRFVAENGIDETVGDDRSFVSVPPLRTSCPNEARRTEQADRTVTANVAVLPDCMALEMVSPPKKFNQRAVNPGLSNPNVSADGQRILYISTAALGDTPGRLNPFGDPYVATRGGSGWSTAAAGPASPYIANAVTPVSFTPDFSRWLFVSLSTAKQSGRGEAQSWAGGLDGLFRPLSGPFAAQGGNPFIGVLQGASADHSRLFWRVGSFDVGIVPDFQLLPGDPKPAPGGDRRVRANAYVAGLDSAGAPAPLQLLARDRLGKVWGGACGARLGADAVPFESGLAEANQRSRNQGALAADGTTAYFSTRPAQPEAASECNANQHKLRIMRRTETPAGPEIEELIESECDRIAPACDAADGDDLYQGASVDQTKVYFTTTRQLADSDLDAGTECSATIGSSSGCDLYLYDAELPEGGRLIQVSAGDGTSPTPGDGADVLSAVTGISGDGSHVYFVAQGVLSTAPNPEGKTAEADKPNLYLYQRDEGHPDGHTAFVGTLAAGDAGSLWGNVASFKEGAYPVPITGKDATGKEVGGDGRVLMLLSRAPLTADDGDGGFRDVFRYDATIGTLERISKAERGGSDNGPFDAQIAAGSSIGTDFAEEGRWASEDGETVVFETKDALVSDDDNGERDSYLLRDGRLARLPGTAGSTFEDRGLPHISHDGSTVAFATYAQLLPQDGDGVQDVYAVRVGGGYPHIVPEPCLPDGNELCQGPAAAPPAGPSFGSGGAASEGNVVPKRAKRCPKGMRKAKRPGKANRAKKARCVSKKKARRQNRASHDRRNAR